jgi:hypothetical protein
MWAKVLHLGMSDLQSPKSPTESSDAAKATSSAQQGARSGSADDIDVSLAAFDGERAPAPEVATAAVTRQPSDAGRLSPIRTTDPAPMARDEIESVPPPVSSAKSSDRASSVDSRPSVVADSRPSVVKDERPSVSRVVELSTSEQRKLEDIRRKLKDIFVTAEKAETTSDTVKASDQQTVSSGLLDLRDLAKLRHGAASEAKVDDDMVHLSGGLFGGSRNAAGLDVPDLSRPTPPPQKPPPPPQAVKLTPAMDEIAVEVEADPDPIPRSMPVAKPASTSAPVVAERTTIPPSSGMSGRTIIGLTLAGTLLFGTVFFMVMRSGGDDTEGKPDSTAIVGAEGQPQQPQGERLGQPALQGTNASDTPLGVVPGAKDTSADDKKPKDDEKGDGKKAGPKGTGDAKEPGATKEPKGPVAAGGQTPTATPVTPPPVETAKAPPPPAADEFDAGAARSALNAAASRAMGCKGDGPAGTAQVSVTFAPSGRVTSARVDGPPFGGTPAGGCIATAFRSATVPPFGGSSITVRKTVSLR